MTDTPKPRLSIVEAPKNMEDRNPAADHEILERLFIDSPVPLQIFDSAGNVRRQNEAQDAFDAAFERKASNDAPEHNAMLMRALAGEAVDYQFSMQRDGHPTQGIEWFERVLTPIETERRASRSVVSITLDVTDRRRMEEEKQRLDAQLLHAQKLEGMGVLAGGIAHDFNNLLVAVLGNASLLARQLTPDSPLRRYVESIEVAARRAADVAHQMLAYSGKGRFATEHVDLAHLIEDTAELLRVSVSRRATLVFDLDRSIPIIRADPTKLRQVVMNLLTNASESMEESPGRITLRTGTAYLDEALRSLCPGGGEAPIGDYVFLEVADEGAGMSPETLSRVFDPFFTTKLTGRGLGLAVVFGIVRAHRGAVHVKSTEGVGTTFRIFLPVPISIESRVEAGDSGPSSRARLASGGLVLVVDDEAAVRLVAARMFEELGFEVVQAGNGLAAVEEFERQRSRIVAIVLDMTMPEADGRTTHRRLRDIGATVPIIMTSGFEIDLSTEDFEDDSTRFLQKPFGLSDLSDTLSSVLADSTRDTETRLF